jgi:hypothetical protein
LPLAARTALSAAIPILIGVATGDVAAGLVATLGTFTARFGGDRPYLNRGVQLAVIAVTLAAGVTNVFVIADEHGAGTAPLSVIMAQDTPFVLYATTATAGLRAVNFADDGAARDLAINHEYAPPILPAIPFGTMTSYVTVPVNASLPVTLTPVGNPGVLEFDGQLSAPAGTLSTMLFTGPAGTLRSQVLPDDRRRIKSEAKLRWFSGASQFTTVTELVLLPPGTTDQTTIGATTALGAPTMGDYLFVKPGEYDLLFRETGTNAVRAGPIHVNFAEGGVYGVVTVNGPDTATASVTFVDDTP